MPFKGTRKRLTTRKTKRTSAPCKLAAPRPSSVRLQWTNQQMVAAINAVKSGGGVCLDILCSKPLQSSLLYLFDT